MITWSKNLKVAQTALEAAHAYAKELNVKIEKLKAENAKLEHDNYLLGKTAESFRLIAGGRFMFSLKDLKPGMQAFHQTHVESRHLIQRPDGKYEFLRAKPGGINTNGSTGTGGSGGMGWESTTMGAVDSLTEVFKYMKKANYFLKE